MNAKKLFAATLAVLTLSGGVFAGGNKETGGLTKTPGVLTVGMEIGYPPFEYYDADGKTPIGFDVQMAKALGAKMGLTVKFVDTAWDGIFAGVTKGDYDCIISAATITPERQGAHNFTRPYIGNAQAIVLLKGSTRKIGKPEDLAGLGVAYQEETTSDIFMRKYEEQGLKFKAYEYEKVMSCFDELKLGRVDAIVCDSLVAVDYVASPNSSFQIVWQGPADDFFGICLKKGNDALTAALDKTLDELFADGTMLKISMDVFNMDLVSAARK
ncbi:MAG: transporter substrate-binding domain-containing protein [Spirochaetaceae bacterium]|jgi:polar amino acid transport system substrate-binding protein|nr:transporter substrate-binding domain-containing protein [Spirochaetaceae bacterium]